MSKSDFQYGSCGGHLGFPHNFSSSKSCPVATEQVSAQTDQRFGRRCQKLIFKMAANGSHFGFSIGSSVLAILCLLGALMLLVKFQLNWIIVFRGDVQNMNSQHFPI